MKKDKETNKSKIPTITTAVIEVLLCCISANSRLAGMSSPLFMAVLGVSGYSAVFCYLGVMAVYFFGTGLSANVFYISSATILLGIKIILMLDKKKPNRAATAVITSASMLASICIVSFFYKLTISEVLFYMFSSILCGALAYIILSVSRRTIRHRAVDINGLFGASLGILYVAFISSMTCISALGLNLGRIISVCVILCAAKKYKHIGGAVCGALTTCAVFVSYPELSNNTMLLATSGLICGAFSVAGSFAQVLVFMISTVLGLAVGFVNSDTFVMLKDAAVGSVLFSLIPDKFINSVTEYVGIKPNAVSIVGHTASSRLNFASTTLSSIRNQITEISDTIKSKTRKKDIQKITGNSVCVNCKAFKTCWEDSGSTVSGFSSLEKILNSSGFVSVKDVLDCIPACKCPTSVAACYNDTYKEKMYDYTNDLRVSELRELVTQQLSAMEDMLCDLSHRINQMCYVDAFLSDKLRSCAEKLGCKNTKACVYYDEKNNYRAELFLSGINDVDIIKLTLAVSEILSTDMDLPNIVNSDKVTKLVFSPKPEYELRLGLWQSSAKKDVYCGDTIEIIPLSANEEYVVLSDGMGTGKRAKLDSMLTSSLTSKLVKAGVSCETAVRMINSILRVKGWEESFATLDIAKFDLYRGVCDFVKAGAASSFLVRDGVISEISLDTMPLGILGETQHSVHRQKLFDGDTIILASDGIGDNGKRIIDATMCENIKSSDKLAKTLGSRFYEISPDMHRDDISIVVIKVFCTAI